MSSINSFLTIGAMIILALVSINFNSAVIENSSVEIENKVALTAFSLADDLLEEIKGKAFDAATIHFPTTNTASLTPPESFGANTKVYPDFEDIDDYHDYIRPISAPHAENYSVVSKVFYVDENNSDLIVNSPTFYKKVLITVSSPYLKHNVNLSFIFTLK